MKRFETPRPVTDELKKDYWQSIQLKALTWPQIWKEG